MYIQRDRYILDSVKSIVSSVQDDIGNGSSKKTIFLYDFLPLPYEQSPSSFNLLLIIHSLLFGLLMLPSSIVSPVNKATHFFSTVFLSSYFPFYLLHFREGYHISHQPAFFPFFLHEAFHHQIMIFLYDTGPFSFFLLPVLSMWMVGCFLFLKLLKHSAARCLSTCASACR